MPRISETLPPMAPNMNPTGKQTFRPVCSRKHCNNFAAVSSVVRVPAIGGAKENALSAPINFKLCTECAKRANVGEFLPDRFKRSLATFCKRQGDARPDFKRAWQPLLDISWPA